MCAHEEMQRKEGESKTCHQEVNVFITLTQVPSK